MGDGAAYPAEVELRFRPQALVRNPHLQTIASSLGRKRAAALEAAARLTILEGGEGVRLQGYYSPQAAARGMVLLLHGWLGSARSNYVLALGEYLYGRGYSIFRLNLRDHGESHGLNRAPFRSDRLAEVFEAMVSISRLEPTQPLHLIGVSLGGNFVLRLAWRDSQRPEGALGRSIAICPVIDPYRTTLALDRGPYLLYFRRKWRAAMRKKQASFPELDFGEALAARSCMAMTEAFVARHSRFSSARAYFEGYRIRAEMMEKLRSPTTIIAAADDPIIPGSDFSAFEGLNRWLRMSMQRYGGHVGFVELFRPWRWLGEASAAILEG